jgi:hypothetical protein
MMIRISWLLRLYPRAWRERYADEFSALLAEYPVTLFTIIDIGLGALDARIFPQLILERLDVLMQRLRLTAFTIFGAFVAFVVAGMGFQKMTEYDDFMTLAHHNIIVGVTYVLVVVGAVAALLGVLAGGVPIALAALRFAIQQRRWDILSRFAVPPLTLVALFAYLKLMARIDRHPSVHSSLTDTTFGIFVALFVLAAFASAVAVISAVNRSDLDERLFRWTRLPAMLTVLAMIVVVAAMITWSVSLWQAAPSLFFGDDGLLASSTVGNLVIHILIMAFATGVAARALLRANRATSASAVKGGLTS